ncbi:hypothetical protein D0T51_02050 [Parabacteroides sp. 52]|uniref:vitamin K epoxide reductase family protein n=1 Tax=unclassified Parabacteroides TaxID=2649774 RepID=UPI0013D3DC06|nr:MULTISPECIES: vitamin K epoxide reductase family protein [unclassified Parabacteroides]MDH6533769.1 putative membrane protein [Parabacteroides sp. PM5-20]NDV54519.1 hypothetical protein [Parabacteroides sp. 52]
MIRIEQNIVAQFLDLLKIKHTADYSNKLFEEHPHRNNLYGLSSMLSAYSVENVAVRLEKDPAALLELEAPFLAYAGNDFALVYRITPDKVSYYWREKDISVSMDKFLKLWSGVVLLAETNENSIEPNYKSNRKKELFHIGEKGILFFAVLLLLGVMGFGSGIQQQIGYLTSLAINIAGVYISYLLLLKQIHIHSSSADKLCSLFLKQGDCNNILDTDAAKFLGLFSWSEIGLGYFTANIIIILCFPNLYPYLAIINILALPYTVWSIWYQAKVAKQWCVLCVIVQVLLWLLFVNNLLFGYIGIPTIRMTDILITGCLYVIPVFVLNILIPFLTKIKELSRVTQQLNSLKADETIFNSLLKQQPYYEIDNSIGLLWGNPEATNRITVITNPHCNPCAKMHKRLEKLLKDTQNGYCIQYILSSFNEELEESSRLFVAMYQKENMDGFLIFLDKWYKEGKNNYKEFYKTYPYDNDNKQVKEEHDRQKEWLGTTPIRATPTVLFNGYELTDKYRIEDLVFFATK